MTFVYENGDINVTLVTLICIGSIVGFLVLVSIFARFGKKEQEELEEYYDEDNDVQPTPKVRAKRKPRPNKVKVIPKTTPKSKQKNKPPVVKKPVVKKPVVKKPVVKKPVVKKPTVKTPKVTSTKVKANDKNKKTNKKQTVNKKTPDTKSVVHKTTVSKPTPKSKIVKEPTVKKPESKKKVEPVVEVVEVKKPTQTKPKFVDKPTQKDDNKPNQTSVKITKVGDVQVDDSIKLNDAEKRMLSGVFTSNNRGHIMQLVNGSKIMDFTIDNPTQLNHIEKQIKRFASPSGSYVVYVVWESNLKHRINLTQKLKYNPNVRYK